MLFLVMQSFRATRGFRVEVVGRLFQLVKGERECKVMCSIYHFVPCPIVQNSHTIVPNCKERRGMWSNDENRRKRKTVWWTTDSCYHNKILLKLHDSHVVRQEPNLLTWDLILSVCLYAYATDYWSTWSKGNGSLEKIWSYPFYWDLGNTLEPRTVLWFHLLIAVMTTFMETKEGNRCLEVSQFLCQEIKQCHLESAFGIQRQLSYHWIEEPTGGDPWLCFIEKSVHSPERPAVSNHITSMNRLSAQGHLRMIMKEYNSI